jgi:phosphatase NudJ
LRVIFSAQAVDDTPPKSVPDEESIEAAWVRLEELSRYRLRGDDVRELFEYVASGGVIYPVDLIQAEGMPYS